MKAIFSKLYLPTNDKVLKIKTSTSTSIKSCSVHMFQQTCVNKFVILFLWHAEKSAGLTGVSRLRHVGPAVVPQFETCWKRAKKQCSMNCVIIKLLVWLLNCCVVVELTKKLQLISKRTTFFSNFWIIRLKKFFWQQIWTRPFFSPSYFQTGEHLALLHILIVDVYSYLNSHLFDTTSVFVLEYNPP